MTKPTTTPRTPAILAALGLAIAACGHQATTFPKSTNEGSREADASGIKRVVLVSMDGLMPNNYLSPDIHGLKIPTLRWMAAQGAFSDGVKSVYPTVTYPSHTSMVTGVNPGRHGIVGNRTFDPLDNDLESWHWYAEEIKTPTIWQVAEEQGLKTGIVHWPVTLGAKVSYLLPEFWRAKNVQDQKLMRVVSTRNLLNDVAASHADFWTRYVPPNVSDDSLTDVALHILATGKPHLLLLHLVEVDGAQHRHGIDSAEARSAIETDDRQLARIYKELSRSGLYAETAVVVVSDHGFRKTTKMVRPCTLLREAGLVTVNDKGTITGWKASVQANSGQAYVYLQDPADHVTREIVRALFAEKRQDPANGIGRVYEADEIRKLGGDPSALLGLEAAVDGDFQFGPGCVGDYVAPPAYHATHGYDPDRPEMRASLLITGPGIPRGHIVNARLIDIAPTIAGWLKLPMSGFDGKPLAVVPEPASE